MNLGPMDDPGSDDMGELSDDDVRALLEELLEASNAGDQHEADNSFEDVPGAEGPESDENEIDIEQLKQMGG